MATRVTDFSEYAVGAQPSDWVKRWDTNRDYVVIDDAGEAALEITGSGNNRTALIWQELSSLAGRDDVMIRQEVSATDAATADPRMASHLAGSDGNETAYFARETETSSLGEYRDGNTTGYESGDTNIINDGRRYIQELKIFRNASGEDELEYRVWEKANSRPETPALSFTQTDPLAVGEIGTFRFNESGVVRVWLFSVGTEGDEAPLSVPEAENEIDFTGVNRIEDTSGNPIDGATIYAVRPGEAEVAETATSDASGEATMTNVPAGTYATWAEWDDGSEVLTTQVIIRTVE